MEAAGPQKMGSPALQARGTHTLCPRRWTSSPRPRLPHVGITPPPPASQGRWTNMDCGGAILLHCGEIREDPHPHHQLQQL